MGKRSAIISVIVLFSGLAILGYFFRQSRKSILTDPYKAVSTTASVIIETIDLTSFINSITTGQGLPGEFAKISEFENFNRKLKFLADQLNKPAYKNILEGSRAVLSFHPSETGRLLPLLALAVKSDVRTGQVRDALKSSGIKTIDGTEISGVKALSLPYNDSQEKDTIFVTSVSGLLLVTHSAELMKSAIKQTGLDNDVRNMPGFERILQASGKNEDKIFIVFSNITSVLQPLLKTNPAVTPEKTGKLAGSSGYDIYLNDNGLILSGYTESINPGDILYKYKTASATKFNTYRILPSATVLFESVVFDPGKQNRPAPGSVSPRVAELAAALRDYTGDEITKAYINIREKPVSGNSVIIYELKNRAYAEKIFLEKFTREINENDIFFFRPDDQISIPIYQTPYKGYVSAFLENYSGAIFDSCFAFYDNYLITGSSFGTISRLLYDNLLNKTLANDLVYRDFETTMPSMSGYFFYCVPSGITTYLSGYLRDDIIKALRDNRISLGKIQAAGYQITPSNNMIYNSLSVQFREEVREESVTEWETLLDTIAAVKPFFFRNHITGATEIFIQDMNNNAYLINAAGRVLWKVPLRERINGAIYMIDYFRNGKLQLLFSGRNYLHLLDRNGNYVERYPVKLRSPATNPVALFDYDNNRNYRLLIAGEDRMIYAYDKSGSVVKGWKPFITGTIVSSEISWFRVSGKDYLVASDENSVYFLDRTGNRRLTLREPVTKAPGSAMRLLPGRTPSVVCSSPDGTVQHIYFDGKIEKFTLGNFSPGHRFDVFDLDGDGDSEYIFIDRGILYVYNTNRSEKFQKQFGSDELGGPINFIFSGTDRKIGVFEVERKLIYLIDSEGNAMEGFPLKGASMFSIGKLSDDGGWHLIVGGTDRFLYNYRLGTVVR
ncbi:MAG TPA: hypothetical protein DDW27_04010 [Bacteroidales bacterium]|nr:hypothetical protein [Bacteroidales bacterium]